jgi:DSF synthase
MRIRGYSGDSGLGGEPSEAHQAETTAMTAIRERRRLRGSFGQRQAVAIGQASAATGQMPGGPSMRPLEALDRVAGRSRDAIAAKPPAASPASAPPQSTVEAARDIVAGHVFEELDVSIDPEIATYWCRMRPQGRPSYTPELLRGLSDMQDSLVNLFAGAPEQPFDYFVVSSLRPGVFNLGGDLALFARLIAAGDRAGLHAYATACIDVVYANYINYQLPIVTIGLVQGDALGGGFEAALSNDVIVAEKGTKFGFPEVLFNLFPGMGAYSMLSRRIGPLEAHRMINDGRIFEAQELHDMGLVHVLAEPGEGEDAVRSFIRRDRRRRNASVAMQQALRRTNPLPYAELHDIVTLWVDAAMQLGESDLRRMQRLLGAQDRRTGDEAPSPDDHRVAEGANESLCARDADPRTLVG